MSSFFSIHTQHKSNNLAKYCCQSAKNANGVGYNKLVTSGNNPKISKAMRYSQYVRTNTGRPASNVNVAPPATVSSIAGTFIGSISGTVLTIESITTGSVGLYQVLSGPGVTYGTFIVQIINGAGGAGTYLVNIGQIAPSTTITSTIVPTAFTQVIPRSQGRGFYKPPVPAFPITTRQPSGCTPCPVLPTL